MQLVNLKDTIPAEAFEKGPDGLSRLVGGPSAAYDILRSMNDKGFDVEWKVVSVGERANGCVWVAGNLTLTERDGISGVVTSQQTVPGGADGATPDFGVSGVMSTALANALLRGFGMADYLYNQEPQLAAPPPQARPVQQTQQPAQQPYAGGQQRGGYQPNGQQQNGGYQRRTPPGGGGYGGNNNGGGAPRNYGPWDGSKVSPKSGQFQNVPYSEIPIDQLQKWASGSSPNPLAVKELDARMQAGGGPAAGSW